MTGVVLERQGKINIRNIEIDETLGADDVRIAIHTVGICGSDVHYYQHGKIGPFVVNAPMVLGHEASGTVIECGAAVTNLRPGDRVCMEPGIPDLSSRATRLGLYNLDPAVRFWATPPIHGVLRPTVVHPAAFTFKLPESVSFGEGAMVEPLAVGMHAAVKARIKPGDIAVVIGAGTIGMLTALAALAGGCSRVIIADVAEKRLDIAAGLGAIVPVNVTKESLDKRVSELTDGWGADIVFEASGNVRAAAGVPNLLCPGGCAVLIGMPGEPIPLDVVAAQVREIRIETVFRYANVYPRALALMGSGRLNLRPLITHRFPFADSVHAFDLASNLPADAVKMQIELPQNGGGAA